MPSAWSVRITPKNYTLDQIVSDLSGTACVVVKHTWSYKTRKDTAQHVHIYWEVAKLHKLKDTFNETIVKKLFPKLDGRHAEYCTTSTDSLESYLDYVLCDTRKYKKKGSELLLWNISEPKPDWIETLIDNPLYEDVGKVAPVTESPLDAYRGRGAHVDPKKNTTEDKQEKFFKFVMEYVALKPHKELTTKKVAKLLYEYSKGGFRPEIAPMYINYAMRNYLFKQGESTPRYKSYRDLWIDDIFKRRIPDF